MVLEGGEVGAKALGALPAEVKGRVQGARQGEADDPGGLTALDGAAAGRQGQAGADLEGGGARGGAVGPCVGRVVAGRTLVAVAVSRISWPGEAMDSAVPRKAACSSRVRKSPTAIRRSRVESRSPAVSTARPGTLSGTSRWTRLGGA